MFLSSGLNHSSHAAHDISRADSSFRAAETHSLPPDFPVNLVAGESMAKNSSNEFYNDVPKDGYFYSTKKAQVKKFSLEKFGGREETGGMSSFEHHEGGVGPGIKPYDNLVESRRAEYASSHFSLPVNSHSNHHAHSHLHYGHHPHPTGPRAVPIAVRSPPPGMVRPVLVPGPPPRPAFYGPRVMVPPPPPPAPVMMVRPRFFSPPPPPPGAFVRAQPVPVFVPPPMHVYQEAGGKHSRGKNVSSRSSSRSSSISPERDRSKKEKGGAKQSYQHLHHAHHRHHNTSSHAHHHHDDSSITSSRPATPPTDYDSAPPRGARVSRKDEHVMRQNYIREMNGPHHGAMTMWPAGRKGAPAGGYYVVPVDGVYGAPTLQRARSVPLRDGEKSRSQSKKDKKSKKSKKSSKKSAKSKSKKSEVTNIEVGEDASDLAMRHLDMTSNTFDNQTSGYERSFSKSAAEKAFSKSLAAETKNAGGGSAYNAYLMNQNGGHESEFPMY